MDQFKIDEKNDKEIARIKDTLRVYSKEDVVKDFGKKEDASGSVNLRNRLRAIVSDEICKSLNIKNSYNRIDESANNSSNEKMDSNNRNNTKILIIDIGCGNGLLGKELHNREVNAKLLAFDFSYLMAKHAAKENRYDFALVGLANKLPLKENSVEVAVAIDVLHHLPSHELQQEAIKELARVSKKMIILEVKTDDLLSRARSIAYKILKLIKKKKEITQTPLAGIVYQKADLKKTIRRLKKLGKERIEVKRVSWLVDWRIIRCS